MDYIKLLIYWSVQFSKVQVDLNDKRPKEKFSHMEAQLGQNEY